MGYDALGPGLARAAKEMVMSYPADAFVRVKAADAPRGALVYIRDFWFLSTEIVLPAGQKRKSLVLTGEQSGVLHGEFPDTGISTAPGIEVQVRIHDPQARVSDGSYPQPGNLVIPPSGAPQIWSRLPDSEFYRRGFTINGEPVDGEDHDHQPFIYFKKYEVWLLREGRALVDRPLFSVS
jgi:hypothetical protein